MTPHLRLFRAPDETVNDEPANAQEPDVHVRLSELLPLVSMAQNKNFNWLKDFLDDEVCISDDLHELLQSLRNTRPSA